MNSGPFGRGFNINQGHELSTFPCIPIMSVCPCRSLWFNGCDLLLLLKLSEGQERNTSDHKSAMLGLNVSLGGLGLKLRHISQNTNLHSENTFAFTLPLFLLLPER